MNNIRKIRDSGLCISCGACSANCPKDCISFELKNGMYQPKVGGKCIDCGRCLRVCPSEKLGEGIDSSNLPAYVLGNYQQILKAKIHDKETLKKSTSGGVVTGVISELLARGEYDAAFAVVGYDYHRQVKTEPFPQKRTQNRRKKLNKNTEIG